MESGFEILENNKSISKYFQESDKNLDEMYFPLLEALIELFESICTDCGN